MAQFPTPGQDYGNWANELNAALEVEFESDGTLKNVARPRGNRVVALGDSLTIGDGNFAFGNLGSRSWYAWVSLLSGGRVRTVEFGNAGVIGQTAAQIAARVSTDIAPLDADYCVVLAGTNDMTATPDLPGVMTTLIGIYDAIKALGKQPVAATIPPRATNGTQVPALNYRIANYAAKRGMPLIDFYSAVVDPATGTIKTAFNLDGTHVNQAGARAMGQAAADVFKTLPGFAPPVLVSSTNGTANLVANGIMVDANANGVADNWSVIGTGGTTTTTVVTDAEALGNWQKFDTSVASQRYLLQSINAGSGWAVGDRLLFAGRMRASGSGGLGFNPRVRFVNSSNALVGYLWPFNAVAGTVTDPVPGTSVWAMEGPIPATTNRLDVELNTASSGTGTVEYAQITVVNLTALGVV